MRLEELEAVINGRERQSFIHIACRTVLLSVIMCMMCFAMIYVGKDYSDRCHKWWQRIETVVNEQEQL